MCRINIEETRFKKQGTRNKVQKNKEQEKSRKNKGRNKNTPYVTRT